MVKGKRNFSGTMKVATAVLQGGVPRHRVVSHLQSQSVNTFKFRKCFLPAKHPVRKVKPQVRELVMDRIALKTFANIEILTIFSNIERYCENIDCLLGSI